MSSASNFKVAFCQSFRSPYYFPCVCRLCTAAHSVSDTLLACTQGPLMWDFVISGNRKRLMHKCLKIELILQNFLVGGLSPPHTPPHRGGSAAPPDPPWLALPGAGAFCWGGRGAWAPRPGGREPTDRDIHLERPESIYRYQLGPYQVSIQVT